MCARACVRVCVYVCVCCAFSISEARLSLSMYMFTPSCSELRIQCMRVSHGFAPQLERGEYVCDWEVRSGDWVDSVTLRTTRGQILQGNSICLLGPESCTTCMYACVGCTCVAHVCLYAALFTMLRMYVCITEAVCILCYKCPC